MEPTVSLVGETDKEPNKYVIKHQVVISAVESCRKVKSDGGVAALSTVARAGYLREADISEYHVKELIKQRTRVGRRMFQAEGTAYAKALGQDLVCWRNSEEAPVSGAE